MWPILQQDKPDDYVFATGLTTKVRDFIQIAFGEVGYNLRFEEEGVEEIGILDSFNKKIVSEVLSGVESRAKIGDVLVRINPRYFRQTEVRLLIGDPTKAQTKLGWKPKYDLVDLVEEMVASDVALFKKDLHLIIAGHTVYIQEE